MVTRGIIPLVKPLITSLTDFKGLRGVNRGLRGNSYYNGLIIRQRGYYGVYMGINKEMGEMGFKWVLLRS